MRPAGKVGAVQCGDLLVEVRPEGKVGLDRMLFLLGYAAGPGFRAETWPGSRRRTCSRPSSSPS